MKDTKNKEHILRRYLSIMNSKFPIEGANWTKLFIIVAALGIVCLGMYNYFMDPFNYFKEDYTGIRSCSQYYKVKYVLNNPNKYNCFIIGGSNSGVLDPEYIEKYTGCKTYSMTFETGNWYNYYNYINFLVKHTDAKRIILHLSSTELDDDIEYIESMDNLRPPAILKEDVFAQLKETSDFLLKNLAAGKILSHETITCKKNGMYDWSILKKKYDDDPLMYINEYVLKDYNSKMSEIKELSLEDEKITVALKYASAIKELCDDNEVELIVICGPVFISKRAEFECDEYYDYLQRLTNIMDIYDFSDISDINANPFNFYDDNHYNDIVAHKLINIVFNEDDSIKDFGIKLTSANINEYIENRKDKWEKMIEEYEVTGTIKYQSYYSDSRLCE